MGLDTTHNCWHGPYSQFMRWRTWLAAQVGIPLGLMNGFYAWELEESDLRFDDHYSPLVATFGSPFAYDTLKAFVPLGRPIDWQLMREHPLVALLHHSDCDGRIRWWECKSIAIALGQLVRKIPNDSREPHANWRDGRGCYDGYVPATKRFMAGCLLAYKQREDVIFR